MFIRKFYDTAVVEAGGGSETEVIETVPMSPAEAMAKHGSKSDENGKIPDPIDIKVTKEEPKTEVKPETATVKEEPKVETKPEETKPEPVKEDVKVEAKAPIVQEQPKQQTLDEVLKTNQPNAILKALGFDDEKASFVSELKDADPKLVGIMQAYKNGTLGDYINALGTDYSKMSDVYVMRSQLRKDYPKVSDAAFEALFEDEVLDKYKLDSETYSEQEVAKGKLLLEAKAARYRDELMANQEKFLMPAKPEPKAEPVPDNTAELKAKENVEAYKREIEESPFAKDIVANKKITLGEGKEKFTFKVEEPSELLATLTDPNEWVNSMYDKVEKGADGKEYTVLNTEKQLIVAAVQKYGTKFLDAYAKHFRGLGGKEVIEPIDNASEPEKSTPSKSDPLPTSAAAAMAKQGVRSNGG
ncbi:MAG: hypothetical protein V4547_16890 [Bacteroidota bacterium]